MPEINDAIKIPLKDGKELVVEVSQHLGDDTVRCIALSNTGEHGITAVLCRDITDQLLDQYGLTYTRTAEKSLRMT